MSVTRPGALAVGAIVDGYVVEAVVGEGGVAVVYQVRHQVLGTRHALKVLKIPAPWIAERLIREGRAQSRLRHPNIVSVTTSVDLHGAPGLIAEFVPGAPLDVFLSVYRPTVSEVDALARDVLSGVAAAHAAGWIHRDLKPSNVLIDPTGDVPVAKVSDFGVAKVLLADDASGTPTASGSLLGTPAYMAPEQVLDPSSVDARADVFALGVMLYEVAIGERPFPTRHIGDVVTRSLSDPPSPRSARPDLPQRMTDAIVAALSPDPRRRPRDAGALLAAWTLSAEAEVPAWTAAGRTAAATLAPAPNLQVPSQQESSATWGDAVTSPEASPAGLPAASMASRGWTRTIAAMALGALGLAAVAAAWVWFQGEAAPSDAQVLTPSHVPVLFGDDALQGDFEAAWHSALEGHLPAARARLATVLASAPEAVLPRVLDALLLDLDGDRSASIDGLRVAFMKSSAAAPQPGTAFVSAFRASQERGIVPGPEMLQYLAQHPTDWFAQLVSARFCGGVPDTCLPLHAGIASTDRVLVSLVRAQSWSDAGREELAREVLSQALRTHPDSGALHREAGQVALALGDVAAAREALARAALLEPDVVPHVSLVRLELLMGVPTWRSTLEGARGQLSASGQVALESAVGDALAGLARWSEALPFLEARTALDASLPLAAIDVLQNRASVLRYGGRFEEARAAMGEAIRVSSLDPSVSNPVRNRLATYGPYLDGLVAASVADGARIDQVIAQLERADFPMEGPIRELRRERAVLDRDAAAIEQLDRLSAPNCVRHAVAGDALLRAGADAAAAVRLGAALTAGCRLDRSERYLLAASRVGLAEIALRAGRMDDARAELVAWRVLWPTPDATDHVVQRAAVVERALGVSPR